MLFEEDGDSGKGGGYGKGGGKGGGYGKGDSFGKGGGGLRKGGGSFGKRGSGFGKGGSHGKGGGLTCVPFCLVQAFGHVLGVRLCRRCLGFLLPGFGLRLFPYILSLFAMSPASPPPLLPRPFFLRRRRPPRRLGGFTVSPLASFPCSRKVIVFLVVHNPVRRLWQEQLCVPDGLL